MPPPSTLSSLLNTDERELPGIIQCLLEPLAIPFHLPNPLSLLPIKSGGSPQWLYNGNALMEYHIKQAGKLPKDQVLATAGLMGQPATDGVCPAAPSLNRSRVSSWLYQSVIERQLPGVKTSSGSPVVCINLSPYSWHKYCEDGNSKIAVCSMCQFAEFVAGPSLVFEHDAPVSVIHIHDWIVAAHMTAARCQACNEGPMIWAT